jgi:flagellar motility protein MotE (MotC chaperone)
VSLDFATLVNLRRHHPAWKLLLAGNAPLIASFLHRVFIGPNVRIMAQDELVAKLDDELFQLRESLGREAFPRSAQEYLNDWADNERGWLRKFYPPGSDEPHFDLTPAAEKAVGWLESLLQRAFVGTESRLLTVIELLRQMVDGAEDDAETRISELERQKQALDQQIARIRAGDFEILDATALRDRFQQLSGLARELLGDFREVEHNFRQLDQNLREQIATWEGRKGELLEQIFGERDAIADSDQGKSFRAFWDFLMSPDRQEELKKLGKN